MHHRSGHISKISLMSGDTENVLKDIEHRIDPDPFCTSCLISSMNKKAGSIDSLKPKARFKWHFMDNILATSPIFLTNETTFLIICYVVMHTH